MEDPTEFPGYLRRNSSNSTRFLGFLACLLFAHVAVGQVSNRLELDLKRQTRKIQQYLADGFCGDALSAATELSKREDGLKSFEVWFAIVQARYCLHDVPATLETLDAMRRALLLTDEQTATLAAFQGRLEATLGQLRLALPGDKHARVRVILERSEAFADPALEPLFRDLQRRLRNGVDIPGEVFFLPLGRYEIDDVEVLIPDYQGADVVVGRGRLSSQKRARLGCGIALGVGSIFWAGSGETLLDVEGFVSDPHSQEGGGLSTDITPFLSLSAARVFRLGALEYIGLRAGAQVRPPGEFLGGTVTGGDAGGVLTPAYYAVFLSIHQDFLRSSAWILKAGLGGRLVYLSYLRYLAFLPGDQESNDIYRIVIDLPAAGGGPQLTFEGGHTFKVRRTGLQVGLELDAGSVIMLPLFAEGEIAPVASDGTSSGTIAYEIQENPRWLPYLSVMVFARMPLF